MSLNVFTRDFTDRLRSVEISNRDVRRYMLETGDSSETSDLIKRCSREISPIVKGKVCFAEIPLNISSDQAKIVDLGFCVVQSKDLSKILSGCDRAIVFAATVGIDIDRLIARYSVTSPSKALCVGAIGSERVEVLCDLFCEELNRKYGNVRKRFSPGYGDLGLSIQSEIFSLLDCPKRIGVSLSDSMLMTPSKSVTAILGVESGE